MEPKKLVDFDFADLPAGLERLIRDQNPWWDGRPGRVLPAFRRWPFRRMARHFQSPIAPILVVRGPRQIGKTTLQEQVIQDLLDQGVSPRRIFRFQFDDSPSMKRLGSQEPILQLVAWYESRILGRSLNEAAHECEPAVLLLDEVQNLPLWHVQLKSLVDRSTLVAYVTGSSALRIEAGRDSLAGRISTLEAGPLRLSEIAAFRGLEGVVPYQQENGLDDWLTLDFWQALNLHCKGQGPAIQAAFAAYSQFGAYPLAHRAPDQTWEEVADQLVETVVKRVIQHDLRMGEKGRKRDEQLLEAVFRLACRYAGQHPGPGKLAEELRHTMTASVGPQRVRAYLAFLDGSLLLRMIEPLEIRLKRRRSSAKICLSDHSIRAAWLRERVPLEPARLARNEAASTLAGRIAESAVGAFFGGLPGAGVFHQPGGKDGKGEIDFVLAIGDQRIPIEVKYQSRLDPVRDLRNLQQFCSVPANNAPFGVVVTQSATELNLPGVVAVPLSHLLVLR